MRFERRVERFDRAKAPCRWPLMRLTIGNPQKLTFGYSLLMVFLAFAFLFISLCSRNIFAVDGAYRCLEVFHKQKLFFHQSNHLLYPANVFVWTRFLSSIGFRLENPSAFFSSVEIMNGLAAAGSLAVLYALLSAVVNSWRLALAGTIACGLSRAFVAQATNANEPMVGVFWSVLGLGAAALYAQKPERSWAIGASGLFFALAMATYQSTIFLAPAALVLIWQVVVIEDSWFGGNWRRLARSGLFTLAVLAGCLLIYGWAYWRSGTKTEHAVVSLFFAHEDARAYFGVSVRKLLNVPIGMVFNIIPVGFNFTGIRDLIASHRVRAIYVLSLVMLLTVLLVFSILHIMKSWARVTQFQRTAFEASLAGFLFTMIPVCLWSPLYDKLWIQPLACLLFVVTLSFAVIKQPSNTIQYSVVRWLGGFVLLGMCANLVPVARSHRGNPYELAEAQRFRNMVADKDLVIGEWDPISILYGTLWADDDRFLSFPTESVIRGPDVVPGMRNAILETQGNGGRVYFVMVLDLSKQNWDAFLGSKCGVPYSALDFYRAHSAVREEFRTRSGPVLVRQLDSRVQ